MQECARLAGSVAHSGRPGGRSARRWRSLPLEERPRQAGGEAGPRQAGGEAEPRQAGGEADPGRQTCVRAPCHAHCFVVLPRATPPAPVRKPAQVAVTLALVHKPPRRSTAVTCATRPTRSIASASMGPASPSSSTKPCWYRTSKRRSCRPRRATGGSPSPGGWCAAWCGRLGGRAEAGAQLHE